MQVALGEDSAEARLVQRPLHEVLHMLAYAERLEPSEGPELLQPRPSTFNMAHHDPNVKLIPLYGAAQQQQPQLSAPLGAAGQPLLQQQPLQQAGPVTYTLGQGLPSQGPQLVVQPIQQQPQQQQQFVPQVQLPAASAAGGPPSSSDNSQLMQVLASLSQSGLSSLLQQQQPSSAAAAQQPVASQQVSMQQQQPPQQQMLQPPPPAAAASALAPPAGIPAGHQLVSLNGMQVLIPPGTPIPAGAVLLGAPAGAMQLPHGFQLPPLAPQQQQQPPPVTIYGGQQPGPPGPMHNRPEEDYRDYGPPGGQWGGGPPPGPLYGRGVHPEGPPGGGPMRHGRGGGMARGGPYERDPGRTGPAPWTNGRLCKFFNSTRGCSKGDVCDFKHVVPGSDLDVREQGP